MFSFLKKSQPKSQPSLLERIEPRIKHEGFLATFEAAGVPAEQRPYVEPLAGDLIIAYAIDVGEQFLFVNAEKIAALRASAEQIRSSAVANLRRKLPEVRIEGDDPLYRPVVGGHLNACLMLIDEFWQNFEEEFSVAPCAIVPHRDAVFVTGSRWSKGVDLMTEQLGTWDFNDNHALSRCYFLRQGPDRWQAYARRSSQSEHRG